MHKYLIDVPVVLYVYIRPACLKRTFDRIKIARPSILFLVSDGPRKGYLRDKERIEESRKIVDNIDWTCKIYKLYYVKNYGIYKVFKKSMDFVFKIVDRCIFLEDDVVVSISFFQFCSELLEKYKDDLRINMICGMNHLGVYDDLQEDYFFSSGASIWGFAFWRRTYEKFYDSSFKSNDYLIARLNENGKKYRSFLARLNELKNYRNYRNSVHGPEYYFRLNMLKENQINIIPKKNMVCNIGLIEGSTNAPDNVRKIPKAIQKVFNMKTYTYDFPLKHPVFVINDENYENKLLSIMGNNFFINICRKCEGIIRILFLSSFSELKKRVKKKVKICFRI
jgi:hypothetical protein